MARGQSVYGEISKMSEKAFSQNLGQGKQNSYRPHVQAWLSWSERDCQSLGRRFDSVKNPTTQIPMNLNFIDPQTRVLNYF